MKNITLATLVLVILSMVAWSQERSKAERITNGPQVKETTKDSAEIAWSTDAPGSSIVKYGENPNALNHKAEKPWGGSKESNGDYDHTVWVKGLRPNTTYYYMVETGQGKGTGTEAQSRPQEFRTK